MTSIRKTKKRLKMEIARLCAEFDYIERTERTTIGKFFKCGVIHQHIQLLEQELQQLKIKKK